MMADPDLVLLHPPSVYDFRRRFAMYGPISDVIPSTPIFEMYPLGYVSLVSYLEEHGYHARIINLAVKMLKDPKLDVERLIEKLNPKAFGIDLHWLVHAAGALDVAALLKRIHPDTPIILGGLSATYYHREIIGDYPQVDYVLRGDSTEEPLLRLMEHIERGSEPVDVENLTWRDKDGGKHVNPLTYVPESLDELTLDYGAMVRLVLRHRDLESHLPYENFMDYPFTALLTCKGCLYNCVTCGGSRYAFKNFFNRPKPAFKSPERLVEEMAVISEYFHSPIFLLGDLRQGGRKYAEEVLEGIRREGIDNTITLELFTPAPRWYLDKMARCCGSFTLEISPESHDDEIRRRQGRPYSTGEMERCIRNALKLGCERFDVFFMIGLPGQSYESALKSVEYSRSLLKRLGDGRIHPFIAPLSPFLDPGSLAFENPDEYGYRRLYTTLTEHREALYQPCWKLFLNYETRWMRRDEIAEATYEAMLRMNRVKRNFGLVEEERAERVEEGLKLARWVMHRIDEINARVSDPEEREKRYEELREEVERARRWTWEGKRELRVTERAGIRLKGVLKHLLGLARRLRGE